MYSRFPREEADEMIAILSPAKNMRPAPSRAVPATTPRRIQEAQTLYAVLREMPA